MCVKVRCESWLLTKMRGGVEEETDVGNNQRVVAYTGDRKATKALKILFRPLQS